MNDQESYYFDKALGYMPAIPEPFYEQWWFGLRKRYVCVECGERFKRSGQYRCHYALTHITSLQTQNRTPGSSN